MKVRVLVRLKSGILDVQGAAVKRALDGLGFTELNDLRVGKLIEVDVDAATPEAARTRVDEMCRRLLANPVLEDYTIELAGGPVLAHGGAGR
ncbi:MAG: phosphoribosylformylglycinamidine synthase subunit PurS [Candidatus Rokubacteria bacterium]|nr:phosphoribosylformylglycinamidine synthase subunit PurS [Candidatus Rokubacteria bacterium]